MGFGSLFIGYTQWFLSSTKNDFKGPLMTIPSQQKPLSDTIDILSGDEVR
jgi:hypothetical protein